MAEDKELSPESIRAEDAQETPTGGYLYPDDQALELVVADLGRCDAFMDINIWAANWILADTLLQSPQNTNQLMGATRSNIPVFTLSNHLSAIVPKAMGALFYENPPFLLRPRPSTTQDLIRAKTALFAYQLDDMEFEEQIELGFTQMAHLGTGIWKYGYTEKTVTEKVYKPKASPEHIETSVGYKSSIHTEESDEIVFEYEERKVCRPWLKFVDRRTVRVDPGCRVGDIRTAKYVIHTEYPSYRDLDDLREQEDYDIPSEAELRTFYERDSSTIQQGDNLAMTMPEGMRGWLQHATPRNQRTTADPLESPFLLIERQDRNSIITVLVHGEDYILVRNSENPACKPSFLSANWRNIPDCFDGQGLGLLIGVDQIVDQGLQNLSIDLIGYGLHPQLVRKKGFNAPTQNIIWRQGGIIDVDDDVDKSFKVLTMPDPPRAAWEFLNMIKAKSQETSGANQQTVMGSASSGGQSTGMRSGTGAAAVSQASASRLDGPVERLIRQVFVPFLQIMDELNNQFLPTSVLRQILDEQGLAELKTDHIKFRNAKMDYEVLAGAHLGPKKEMAQFMPFMIQIVNNPTLMQSAADAGMKFRFDAFFKAMGDLAGFKYSQQFFTKMSPEEQQKHDANSPAATQAAQAQSMDAAGDKKFQQEQVLENQKEIGRAANRVLEKTMDHATSAEEITGQANGTGFGSEVQG